MAHDVVERRDAPDAIRRGAVTAERAVSDALDAIAARNPN
jgi:hypothetical protein